MIGEQVPIIKIKEVGRTGLDMDIAIQSSQQSVANLVTFYCDQDDRVRPFIIAIKHWSKRRGLCDAMNNYPNSFGFVLLCIKFLQMVNVLPVCCIEAEDGRDEAQPRIVHEVDGSKPNSSTLLELMVQFFEMYRRFNFKLLQISTSTLALESKIEHPFYRIFKQQRQTTMVVQDPSCHSANVTRNVRPYRLTIMQNEFFRAYKATKHGDWDLLMAKFTTAKTEVSIFEFYPPSDDEQQHLYDALMEQRGLEQDNAPNAMSDSFEYEEDLEHELSRWSGDEEESSPVLSEHDDFKDVDTAEMNRDFSHLTMRGDGDGDGDGVVVGNEGQNERECDEELEMDSTPIISRECGMESGDRNGAPLRSDDEEYAVPDAAAAALSSRTSISRTSRVSRVSAYDDALEEEEIVFMTTSEVSSTPPVAGHALYDDSVRQRECILNGNVDSNHSVERVPGQSGYRYPMMSTTQTPGRKGYEYPVETRGNGPGQGQALGPGQGHQQGQGQGQQEEVEVEVDECFEGKHKSVEDEEEYHIVGDRTLISMLDSVVMDHDVHFLWKLTPFKTMFKVNVEHLEVEYIGLYHLDKYALSMAEFVGICKYYLVAFNVEFMRYYAETVEENKRLKNDVMAMFDVLDYDDVSTLKLRMSHQSEGKESVQFQAQFLEEFVKFENEHFFKNFLNEFHVLTGQDHEEAVPYTMEELMVSVLGDNQCHSLLVNYSWFVSLIALFSMWTAIFADIEEMAECTQDRMVSVSRLLNAEWLMHKMEDSMIVLGLQCQSQADLLQIIKSSTK